MPRYFFNQVGKQIDRDVEGLMLADLLEAHTEAILFAADTARRNHLGHTYDAIEVTDDAANVIFEVSITVLEGEEVASLSL